MGPFRQLMGQLAEESDSERTSRAEYFVSTAPRYDQNSRVQMASKSVRSQ
jgi:hypothetical protein